MSYNSASPHAKTARSPSDDALYRALFERAGDSLFISTPTGQHIDVNARACQLLGYTRDELLHLIWADMLEPEHRERDLPHLNELLAGTRELAELWLRRKDGSPVIVEVNARPIADAQIGCVVRDIGARHMAEHTLRGSERQLRYLVDRLPAGVLIATPNGELLFRNQQLDAIFRHPPEPAGSTAGERCWPLFDPASGEPFLIDSIPLISSLRFGQEVANHQIMILR
ncbi:MAG TPA: PAS domain S-box protein, partial [Roseiflexaceae bacterium]|nr:PAS domain S-box protein [Roseiflexaceae bacterium]